MAGYTPGPWGFGAGYEPGSTTFDLYSASGVVIAHAAYEGMWLAAYDKETDSANARLIAAAPDGYDVIAAFIEACDPACLVENDHPQSAFSDVLRAAYAYRAKATGAN